MEKPPWKNAAWVRTKGDFLEKWINFYFVWTMEDRLSDLPYLQTGEFSQLKKFLMINTIMRRITNPKTSSWVFLCGPQSYAASSQMLCSEARPGVLRDNHTFFYLLYQCFIQCNEDHTHISLKKLPLKRTPVFCLYSCQMEGDTSKALID